MFGNQKVVVFKKRINHKKKVFVVVVQNHKLII